MEGIYCASACARHVSRAGRVLVAVPINLSKWPEVWRPSARTGNTGRFPPLRDSDGGLTRTSRLKCGRVETPWQCPGSGGSTRRFYSLIVRAQYPGRFISGAGPRDSRRTLCERPMEQAWSQVACSQWKGVPWRTSQSQAFPKGPRIRVRSTLWRQGITPLALGPQSEIRKIGYAKPVVMPYRYYLQARVLRANGHPPG